MGHYAILSPFVVTRCRPVKVSNLGDEFILDRAMHLIGGGHDLVSGVYSTRYAPTTEEIETINQAKFLLIVGSNQLDESFLPWRGFERADLKRIQVPIIPMAIGPCGNKPTTAPMTEHSKYIVEAIHERIQYSSWRSPDAAAYLHANIPHLQSKIRVTGCPVMYDRPLLEGAPLRMARDKILMTITNRGDFYLRERRILDFVLHHYPNAYKVLSLHQYYPLESQRFSWKNFFWKQESSDIISYARSQKIDLFIPSSAQTCFDFYRNFDLHIGSRLHAHLYFLSQAIPSELAYVDERMQSFSNYLGFPLFGERSGQRSEKMAGDWPFEHYRTRCREEFKEMEIFIDYLRGLLV